MKKKLTLTLSLSILTSILFAQTKLIAHKSHSGNKQHFKTSLTHHLFDSDYSNFGMAPQRFVKQARLDSVIFISKSKAIVVTSSCVRDVRKDTSSVWKPGREIALNHPLFSKQHSLDSIKHVLKTRYYFANPIKEVVFVGYDNKKKLQSSEVKKNSIPVIGIFNSPNSTPFNFSIPFLVGILSIVSLLLGFVLFKLNNLKLKN